ncbi:uncharacterized protein [Palaemon carinicauda]|uniref:uncharacterized protein n=1 Tax=Palaemon carinicauda TaxID=392227 RepID=UPI0035B5A473
MQPLLQAASEPLNSDRVGFYIPNANAGRRFLVDIGASVSTFPHKKHDNGRLSDNGTTPVAANGSPIPCYGTRMLKSSFRGQEFSWPFLIADIKTPLLSTDFLAPNGLLVDVHRKRLVDQETYQSHRLSYRPSIPHVCSVTHSKYNRILQEFLEVFKPELQRLEGISAWQGIYHHITTTGPLTHSKFRHLPPQKLQDNKRALLEMERMGV